MLSIMAFYLEAGQRVQLVLDRNTAAFIVRIFWLENRLLCSIYRDIFSDILCVIVSSFPLQLTIHLYRIQRLPSSAAVVNMVVTNNAISPTTTDRVLRSNHVEMRQQFHFKGTLMLWRRPDENMWKYYYTVMPCHIIQLESTGDTFHCNFALFYWENNGAWSWGHIMSPFML